MIMTGASSFKFRAQLLISSVFFCLFLKKMRRPKSAISKREASRIRFTVTHLPKISARLITTKGTPVRAKKAVEPSLSRVSEFFRKYLEDRIPERIMRIKRVKGYIIIVVIIPKAFSN